MTNLASPLKQEYIVRAASAQDASALLDLMKQLATFERYIDSFRMTEQDLINGSLNNQLPPLFFSWVAHTIEGELVGYTNVYEIEFTYDMRLTLVLKELFVVSTHRGLGLGQRLMSAVLEYAKQRGCGRLQWMVLPENVRAKAFYRRFGGSLDTNWEPWIIHLPNAM